MINWRRRKSTQKPTAVIATMGINDTIEIAGVTYYVRSFNQNFYGRKDIILRDVKDREDYY